MDVLSSFVFGDTVVKYITDSTGCVGLLLLPSKFENEIADYRTTLNGVAEIDIMPFDVSFPARPVESLVQLKCVGDAYSGGFAQGRTMRGSESVTSMRYQGQDIEQTADASSITTTLKREGFYKCKHILTHYKGEQAFDIETVFENISDKPITLEMLSSFCIDGITPFDTADASGKLFMHRFRSSWSSEGRHECCSLEDMQLERSWSGACASSERFGQVGSQPVRGFFSFAALEDREKGVFWGARLACASSWQMEFYRRHDTASISGGLADRELGHWLKHINPGESFTAPSAAVAVSDDGFEQLCSRLTNIQKRQIKSPKPEADLPIVYNEWCTSWGGPTEEKVLKIADRIKNLPFKYFVIDAGWYAKDGSNDWGLTQGDWIANKKAFPNGLKFVADAIRSRGLIPGIWFEMETAGLLSDASQNLDHLFLKRNGKTIISGERKFWDFRKPETIAYLKDKIINLLSDCGFGYLKIDYNETIGIGADGSESQGESLREHIAAVHSFLAAIKDAIPDIVIENCSSGGHRLEPSMLGATSMSSFSDAHETKEIPLIAANLHNLVLPAQSQIWAVLRATDEPKRTRYSLAATLLGRMCISGDILELNDEQLRLLSEYMNLYRNYWQIIRDGYSRRFGHLSKSFRHAKGNQALLRISECSNQALIVAHSFENGQGEIEIPLQEKNWEIKTQLKDDQTHTTLENSSVKIYFEDSFCSAAMILEKSCC